MLGVIRCEPLVIREERLPADVRRMMAVNDDRPLGLRSLDGARPDVALWIHHAAGLIAPKHVRTRVGGIGEQAADPTVGQTAPPNLSGPCPAIARRGNGRPRNRPTTPYAEPVAANAAKTSATAARISSWVSKTVWPSSSYR